MTIYTRFGTPVRLTEAQYLPVWIRVMRNGDRELHNSEPKRTTRTREIETLHVWHMRAASIDPKDNGRPIGDGERGGLYSVNQFRATDGIREICDACRALNPEHAAIEDAD